ncbi:tripartite tricarboxylate transporter substrate-binding protein [Cupriavidus sp. 8B]
MLVTAACWSALCQGDRHPGDPCRVQGSAPAITDLIAGSTQFMLLPLSDAQPLIKGGKLKALAITSAKRSTLLPEIPTIKEATGMSSLEMGA